MNPAVALLRRAIRITAPLRVELVEERFDDEPLKPQQLLIESECSVVSAGTELAIYRGTESWTKPPTEVGYGVVGRVLRAGENARFSCGDRVFAYGSHASINVVDDAYAVPEELDAAVAPLAARMGQVAFTAVRVARPELGDVVAVIGLGLVGNLCAQLMRLSGCTVIGLDVSPRRLAAAKACGIDHVVDTSGADPEEAIVRLSGGAKCRSVVEASGVPALAATATRLAAQGGQVILLGTPRGEFAGDATEMLRCVHASSSNVTLVGAHEWIYPRQAAPGARHSLTRNIQQLLALVQQGRLRIDELITHRVPPERCRDVYTRLLERDDAYLGVIFDWRGM